MNEQDEAFQAAIQAHQLALAVYGDAHPKTTEAMLAVMLLAPPEVFAAQTQDELLQHVDGIATETKKDPDHHE